MLVRGLSGETLAELHEEELSGLVENRKNIRDLKRLLATKTGVSRFRQRLVDINELTDDMPVALLQSVQLVVQGFCSPDEKWRNRLLRCCRQNSLDRVEKLLQRPQDPDEGASEGSMRPSHTAAREGHLEVMKLLIEARADMNLTQAGGMSALSFAAERGKLDMVHLLLHAGASPDVCGPLLEAAFIGDLRVVKVLHEAQADVNARRAENGLTALHHAAGNGCLEVARWLVEAGVEIDAATSGSDRTPWALMPAGSTDKGLTALHAATLHGHLEVVRLLLDAGADHRAGFEACGHHGSRRYGITALHAAATDGDTQLVRLLLNAGASANAATPEHGITPLHAAALWGHLEAAQCLLDGGADQQLAFYDEGEGTYLRLTHVDLAKRQLRWVSCTACQQLAGSCSS